MKKSEREQKILDIIKRIESNDPVILRDMAEIILAAEEKVSAKCLPID